MYGRRGPIDVKANIVVTEAAAPVTYASWEMYQAALMLRECDSGARRSFSSAPSNSTAAVASNLVRPGWNLTGAIRWVHSSKSYVDEKRGMGDIVRKANTGFRRHRIMAIVLITIAYGWEEGGGYPDLPIPGIRVGREEKWVEDGKEKSQSAS